MVEQLDPESRLKLYGLIVRRYGKLIGESEERSISEIRQTVSPYNDTIRGLRDGFTREFSPYDYEVHFLSAVQKALEHLQGIRNCRFPFTLWLSFAEMEELKLGDAMNKALLLAAMLRSLDSKDVRVIVTKSGKPYVGFGWKGQRRFINPESGSMLEGEEGDALLAADPAAYAFSDLFYENYGEE